MQVKLYPNPTFNGNATLELKGVKANVTVTAIGLLGNTLAHYTINKDGKISLPASSLTSGTYSIVVSTGKERKVLKWINIKL